MVSMHKYVDCYNFYGCVKNNSDGGPDYAKDLVPNT